MEKDYKLFVFKEGVEFFLVAQRRFLRIWVNFELFAEIIPFTLKDVIGAGNEAVVGFTGGIKLAALAGV